MLVWMTLVAGALLLATGVIVVMKVDQQWRSEHLQCCRCLQVWFSRDKMCFRCGARGKTYDWLAAKYAGFPTHDWQGYLHTGPIPRVPAPIHALTAAPRELVPQQRSTSPYAVPAPVE